MNDEGVSPRASRFTMAAAGRKLSLQSLQLRFATTANTMAPSSLCQSYQSDSDCDDDDDGNEDDNDDDDDVDDGDECSCYALRVKRCPHDYCFPLHKLYGVSKISES